MLPVHVSDRKRPPLSPREGWLSDGRQVLHFQPRRYDRWEQILEVTDGELIPGEPAPLLKRRRQLSRQEVISHGEGDHPTRSAPARAPRKG